MKVLMLGWEYPPHISGGLGTACEGLTRAVARLGTEIVFVVPKLFGGEDASHMQLVDSADVASDGVFDAVRAAAVRERRLAAEMSGSIEKHEIPSLLSPYFSPGSFDDFVKFFETLGADTSGLSPQELLSLLYESGGDAVRAARELGANVPHVMGDPAKKIVGKRSNGKGDAKAHYKGDLFAEVERFTAQVIALAQGVDFDVIHAHDWMTYPAGVAVSKMSGKPLVCHVHSLEYDRSGQSVNPRIHSIERLGLQHAQRVIAVSHYTTTVINREHNIPHDRVSVVHNGIYPREMVERYRREQAWPRHVVLFLGRITFQKGPDYFVEAAARIIPHVPDVLFVMAGSGDMLPRLVNRVAELGLGQYFHFPGFLRGEDVERMFSVADLYVMPSVSEPFGISALEAISFDTPVVISRQSGVSEVLSHALKTDFWDIDRLADLMINALLYPELRQDMVSMAREEVRRLRWDAAALKTMEIYRKVV